MRSSSQCPADWLMTGPAGPAATTLTASSGNETQNKVKALNSTCGVSLYVPSYV